MSFGLGGGGHLGSASRAVPLTLGLLLQSNAFEMVPFDRALRKISKNRTEGLKKGEEADVVVVAADHLAERDSVAGAVRGLVGVDREIAVVLGWADNTELTTVSS